jgi:hypothetical protein
VDVCDGREEREKMRDRDDTEYEILASMRWRCDVVVVAIGGSGDHTSSSLLSVENSLLTRRSTQRTETLNAQILTNCAHNLKKETTNRREKQH